MQIPQHDAKNHCKTTALEVETGNEAERDALTCMIQCILGLQNESGRTPAIIFRTTKPCQHDSAH